MRRVHEVDGIERIRFSSIEPNVVTEEFAQTMAALSKVCGHFHLSLQSEIPAYEQIKVQIKAQILNGELAPNQPLTSMRLLAGLPAVLLLPESSRRGGKGG